MKSLLFCLFFAAISNLSFQLPVDEIDFKGIQIKNKLNKTYTFDSATQLQKVFGEAKVLKEVDEVLDGYAYTYMYPGFETYFNEKNWESSDITGRDFTLFLNNKPYKVGDPISKFKAQFPISYKNRDLGKHGNRLYIQIKRSDSSVCIFFSDKGIVTLMSVSNDNS